MAINAHASPRIVDIADLVRLRKHVSGSATAMGWLSFFCLAVVLHGLDAQIRDLAGFAAVGTLALAGTIVLIRGRLEAAPALAFAMVATSVPLTTHFFFVSRPIGTNEDIILPLVTGSGAILVSLHLLWTANARFFQSARRSPYVQLLFATRQRLGERYAGGALSWKEWLRELRPWAVVVAVLTYVAAIGIAAVVSKGRRDRQLQKQISNTILSVGGALFVWTKRKSALRGVDMRQIDRRPPVLLLRSFDDDMMVFQKGARDNNRANLHRHGMTFERVIEDYLAPFGPFIAIGRPDEPLSPLGAARDYVPDRTWQGEVEQRLRDASIIVLVIGTSQGLAWEIGRVADLAQLHKLILLFPPAGDVELRWQTLLARDSTAMNPVLPELIRPNRTLALIYADDLTPIVVEGERDERSYETALRLAGMLAITTGAEPAGSA